VPQFKLLYGPLKNTVLRLKMDSHCQLKKIIRVPRSLIKMLYVLVLHHLYQYLHKRKADNTRLSNTMVNCSFGLLLTQPVKRYALMFARDLRYRTPQVLGKLSNIAASILYSASFRSFFYAARKVYTGASFYLMATATNYTKIREYLRLSYQAH
jgi:hypothetical protein